jgi:hypothetical protein
MLQPRLMLEMLPMLLQQQHHLCEVLQPEVQLRVLPLLLLLLLLLLLVSRV